MGIGSGDDIKLQVIIDDKGAVKAIQGLDGALIDFETTVENTDKKLKAFEKTGAALGNLVGGALLSGFVALGSAMFATVAALDNAAKIEGVTTSFENLQASVGQVASNELQDLRVATKGLVSDMDLMVQANKAVLLGLPAKEFDVLAGAAIKLGRAVGQDATKSVDDLTTALGRNSPEVLDNLGVKVKAAEVEDFLAQKYGTTTDKLSESQKAMGFQELAISRILEKNATLAESQETAAQSFARLTTSATNARDQFAVAASGNEELRDSFDLLDAELKKIDFKGLGNGFAQLTGAVVKMGAKVLSVAQGAIKDFIRGLNIVGQLASQAAAGEFPSLSKAISEADKVLLDLGKNSKTAEEQLKGALSGLKTGSEGAAAGVEKLRKEKEKASKKTYELIDFIDYLAKDSLAKNFTPEIQKAVDATRKGEASLNILALTMDELRAQFIASGGEAQKFDSIFTQVFNNIEKTAKKATSKKGQQKGFFQDLAESLFGSPSDTSDSLAKEIELSLSASIAKGLDESFADLLRTGIDAIKSGEDIGAKLGEALGGAIGSAIGTAIGGQLGGDLGGLIGSVLGEEAGAFIDKVFGGKGDKQTAVRRDIEGFIDETLRAVNLKIISASGNLTTISDLVLGDRDKFRGGSDFNNFIESLPLELSNAFLGFGQSLGQILGDGFDEGGQVGAVLLDTFGGNIDNLKLLVAELGLTFEDAQAAMTEAFLQGSVGASEVVARLRDMEEAFKPGLAAIGDVTGAFDNLIASAGQGRISIKSIQDLGIEAQENGAKSLEDLRTQLVASGKYTTEEIDKLFTAFEQNGIKSFEDLAAASDLTLIGIVASLEKLDFDFSDQIDENITKLTDLNEEIEKIPSEIVSKVRIEVSTQYKDADAEKAFKGVIGAGPGIA